MLSQSGQLQRPRRRGFGAVWGCAGSGGEGRMAWLGRAETLGILHPSTTVPMMTPSPQTK